MPEPLQSNPWPGALLLAFLLLLAAIDGLSGQSVRGAVRDGETGAPVGVAMVLLEDLRGERARTTLTNDRGNFLIRAPGPGRYRLRIERIGFRTYTSDPFELGVSEDLSLELRIRTQAIRLDEIVVGGEARCRLPREESAAIVTLWEEARKSLELAAWGEAEGGVHVRVRGHEAIRDLVTGEIRDRRFRTWSGTARDPFLARPAEDLAREGFVVDEGDGYAYFGLSAETILSDAFQETHCFRVRRPGRGQSRALIGLAFEPVPGRSLPDVSGVLWLDRETAVLDRVEYTYTRHLVPLSLPLEAFGGRTDFRRLANGAIIAEGWWIRMPRFERTIVTDELPSGAAVTLYGRDTERDRERQLRRAGVTIREVGARAVFIAGAGPSDAVGGTAEIRGVIHDSIEGVPLVGATVYLSGARQRAGTTDSTGRFRLQGIAAGTFDLAFDHPSLDALGWTAEPLAVSVSVGDTLEVRLATPSVGTVLGGRCDADQDWVVGFVRSESDGSPLAGALVVAEWEERWRRSGEHAFTADRVRRGAVTDEAGAYALCNVRPGTLRVGVEGQAGSARNVELWRGEGGRADFAVSQTR